MKILATLGVLSIVTPFALHAQSGNERKVRIEITRNENGNTSHVTREFDLSDEKQLADALRELGVMDELNVIGQDENLVLDLRRMREGGPLNDMSIALSIPNEEEASSASAYLGVYYSDWTGACSDDKKKKDQPPVKEGACITGVENGTPAESAGLKEGDVIVMIGSKKVKDGSTLLDAIAEKQPGESVQIVYYRGKEKKETTAVLTSRTEEESTWNWNWQSDEDGNWSGASAGEDVPSTPFLGVDGQNTENDKGVIVTDVVQGSPAESMGLKKDDIIQRFAGKKVSDFETLADLIGDATPGEEVEVEVLRDGKPVTLKGELGKTMGTSFNFNMAPFSFAMPEMPEMPEIPEAPEAPNADELRLQRDMQQQAQDELQMARDEQQRARDEMRREMDELRREMDHLRQDLRGDVTREMRVSISAVELSKDESDLLKSKGVNGLNNALDVQDLRCFPNPAQSSVHVSFTAGQRADLNVDVHDSTGERVYHESITGFKGRYERVLDLSDRADGTYFVVITQGGASVARKIVKQ